MSTDLIAVGLERLADKLDHVSNTVSDIRVRQAELIESVKHLKEEKDRLEGSIIDVKGSVKEIKDIPKNTLVSFIKGLITSLGAASAGWFLAKGGH